MSLRKIKYKIQLRENQMRELKDMMYTREERIEREKFLVNDICRLQDKLSHDEMLRPLNVGIIISTLVLVGFIFFVIFAL